ncbi:MAG TPA: hypothetical protein VHT75_20015 [Acidimicrobiales bacterium]|jgi:hypothetical protein|nr:hypothetical protein [Acidimicrobiales bacterium]
MARRIDIELTSARPDGSWTWRAAGALKPRGVLDGTLLAAGAKPGDVVRVDAEFEIDGISIVAVLPPKEKKRAEPERLEIIGPPRAPAPGVTTSLTRPHRDGDDASRRPRRDGAREPGRNGASPDGGERGPRPSRARPEGSDRGAGGPRPGRSDRQSIDRGSRPGGPLNSGAPGGARPGSPGATPPGGVNERHTGGPSRGQRPARPPRDPASSGTGPEGHASRPGGPGDGRPDDSPRRDGGSRDGGPRPAANRAAPERPRPRRLSPGNAHRSALLESLPPEHRPIAEQVIRGGIPAVRTAIHLEGEKAAAEGRPPPHAEALLAIAEELLPKVKAAEWRDRADAAAKLGDDLPLRDLRAILEGASAARDDESRNLAANLRDSLERRLETMRTGWIDEITANLNETRVVRALRLSARPPDATTKLPADLAAQLTEAAGKAMSPETPSERWAAMLEAVAASPVRRQVKPEGLPADASETLLQAARQQSGRVPALAAMLGISMPPPPGPIRPRPAPAP